MALENLFGWRLTYQERSLIARLGSGSACRSFWHGIVHWHQGCRDDGLDSYAMKLPYHFDEFRIGLLIVEEKEKKYSSRKAMIETVQYSRLYQSWPHCVDQDIKGMLAALKDNNLPAAFEIAERNARAMHATMMDLPNPILYANNDTFQAITKVLRLRSEGIPVFYTQDAGPNLKLLFEEQWTLPVQKAFPSLLVVKPFETPLLALP